MRKYARLVVAAFAIVFAIFVARQLKRRTPEPVAPPVVRTDPKAVAESTGGIVTSSARHGAVGRQTAIASNK